MNGPFDYEELRRRAEEARRAADQAKEHARAVRRQARDAWRQQHHGPRAGFLWNAENVDRWRHDHHHGPFAPLVGSLMLIIVGALLLASQVGLLPFSHLWRLWPIVFVFAGLHKITHIESGKWISSLFLIAFGGLLIAHEFDRFAFGILELWPMLLIGFGVELLWKVWNRDPSQPTGYAAAEFNTGTGVSNAPLLESINIFGGTDQRILNKEFTGGRAIAVFGGYKLDLSQAEIKGDSARIEASAVFGGGEIIVPRHWTVVMKGVGIFGGYNDETGHVPPPPGWPSKTLIIEGGAVFGGVEIKN